MNSELKRSVCPFDCPDACGLIVKVENGKALKVAGDPEHPFTMGKLCPKMVHYEKTVHSPERLSQPLLRTGTKGTNQFKPISWEEAITRIKNNWMALIEQYGAETILPYSYGGTMGLVQRNCGNAFFNRLGASNLERTICSSAKGYGWSAVMDETLAPHPDEVVHSDLVILWGTNAMATNIHFIHKVREAKKRGAKVWLIETHETPTAKVADKIIVVRPGSDGALALGMMHVLARDGLVDAQFLAQYVSGYEKLKTKVLPDFTPETAARITGLTSSTIEELARLYAGASTPFIKLGSGLSRYGNGAMTVRCILCLPALTGAWGKKGGGLLGDISTSGALDTAKITRNDFLKTPVRSINMNQLGDALNQTTDIPIKSLYVYHSNPAAVAPDQNKVLKGLLREDLFTIVHERFLTDTALYADIVLPATTSLEHPDIYRSYGHYCIQRAYPVIKPVGQAKSNWDVFALLSHALGFEDPFFDRTAEEMVEELINPPTEWLAQADIERLHAGLAVELPLPVDYKTTFLTPSGKIEIDNPREAEPLPRYFEPHGDDAPYWFVNIPNIYSLNSTFNEQPELVRKKGKMYLLMNPQDAISNNLCDGQRVIAFNQKGEVTFILKVTAKVPRGVVVSEGIFWLRNCPGNRSVNALTSQRLTDRAAGSTFYDTKVDVRPE